MARWKGRARHECTKGGSLSVFFRGRRGWLRQPAGPCLTGADPDRDRERIVEREQRYWTRMLLECENRLVRCLEAASRAARRSACACGRATSATRTCAALIL